MSPKRLDEKFPPIRVTKQLLDDTKKCANEADEDLSEYVRKAVEKRNKSVKNIKRDELGNVYINDEKSGYIHVMSSEKAKIFIDESE